MSQEDYRTERDSMGEMKVPKKAYYAAQTQRAVKNFPISSVRFGRPMISALGLIKLCAAETNFDLSLLDKDRKEAIVLAASEVLDGKLDDHFVVDVFQTGSGTSTNMNANEVIANRARRLSKKDLQLHPNDHVNMGQSSNDVIPTAIHIAVVVESRNSLFPSLRTLKEALAKKSSEFASIVKSGRTHLQDATPLTLGQEFSGYESQVKHAIERLERSLLSVLELPLGGTAVGTGINSHVDFARICIDKINRRAGADFREAENHFEAQGAKDALVEFSAQLRTLACSLSKIANDIRWLASGPRAGLGELLLPAVQPGSSIMPGKVNPVIIESLLMVAAQVAGNDTAVFMGGHSGSILELNVMMPLIAHNILESIEILGSSCLNFASKCVSGIEANEKRLRELAEANISICTALAPVIGYDKSAEVAKKAYEEGLTVREVALREKLVSKEELEGLLDLMAMTKPCP